MKDFNIERDIIKIQSNMLTYISITFSHRKITKIMTSYSTGQEDTYKNLKKLIIILYVNSTKSM
jgi:hypothetical protein